MRAQQSFRSSRVGVLVNFDSDKMSQPPPGYPMQGPPQQGSNPPPNSGSSTDEKKAGYGAYIEILHYFSA